MNPEISIVIPSINPDRWTYLLVELSKSLKRHTCEVIFVGPKFPPLDLERLKDVFYIRSFASPSVAFMAGAQIARGRFIAFLPDDISMDEDGLDKAIDLLQEKPWNHGMTLLYKEGNGDQDTNLAYWKAGYHADQRLEGINPEWQTAPVFMFSSSYFFAAGGLDCGYEHVNMNTHGLCYYTQYHNGVIHYSPTRIFCAGWQPPTESTILYQAYLQNDAPRFKEQWGVKDAAESYRGRLTDWKQQPAYWPRRYPQL